MRAISRADLLSSPSEAELAVSVVRSLKSGAPRLTGLGVGACSSIVRVAINILLFCWGNSSPNFLECVKKGLPCASYHKGSGFTPSNDWDGELIRPVISREFCFERRVLICFTRLSSSLCWIYEMHLRLIGYPR